MASLSRAAAHWADPAEHHRNIWNAVRTCSLFMRQLNELARQTAAARAAAKIKAAEASLEPPPGPPPGPESAARGPVDVAALADEVMATVDAREAHEARRGQRSKGHTAHQPDTGKEDTEQLKQNLIASLRRLYASIGHGEFMTLLRSIGPPGLEAAAAGEAPPDPGAVS